MKYVYMYVIIICINNSIPSSKLFATLTELIPPRPWSIKL